MLKPVIASLILVGTLGCTSTTVIPIGEGKSYPKRTAPEKVQVFLEKPDTTFTQIALIDYSGYQYQGKSDAIYAIKKKASELGGDAIILQGVGKEYENPVAKAIVIRFIP